MGYCAIELAPVRSVRSIQDAPQLLAVAGDLAREAGSDCDAVLI
jgi:hypothetical protein